MALLIVPSLFNFNFYKSRIINVIKKNTGVIPTIDGNIEIKVLPLPTLRIHDLTIPNISQNTISSNFLSTKVLNIQFSPMALLSGKIVIKNIGFVDPLFELETLKDNSNNWSVFLSQDDQHKLIDNKFIKNIDIKNAHITYHSDNTHYNLDYVDFKLNIDPKTGAFIVDGKFDLNDSYVKFNSESKQSRKHDDIKLNISSDSFNTEFTGRYDITKEYHIDGKLVTKINNLSKFAKIFFPLNSSLSAITSKEAADISGEFTIDKKNASFKNIKISSNNLKTSAELEAFYSLDKNKPVEWELNAVVDLLNIDNLYEKEKKAEHIDYNSNEHSNYSSVNTENTGASYNIDIPKTLALLVNLEIKKIIFNKNEIKDLNIDIDVADSNLLINRFEANLPGDSTLEFSGNMSHNGTRPLLIGSIKWEGKKFSEIIKWLNYDIIDSGNNYLNDFLFSCNVNLTPQKIIVSDIYGTVDRSLITGSMNILPRAKIPFVMIDTKIDSIDFDKYNLTEKIASYMDKQLVYDKNANIDTSWLRTVNYNAAINITANDLIYNQSKIKNINATIALSPGVFNLQRITLNGEKASFISRFKLSINGEKPEFDLDFKSPGFDSSAFIVSNNDEGKKDSEDSDKNTELKEIKWSNNPFKFIEYGNFNAKTNIEFTALKHKNFLFKDVKFNAVIANKVISIKTFAAKLGLGEINIQTNIGMTDNLSMASSFKLSNMNLKDLYSLFFNIDKDVPGYANIAGTFKSVGNSTLEWVKNLKGTVDFVAANVLIDNFNINEIIKNARSLYSVLDMEKVVKQSLAEGKTLFTNIKGQATIDKNILSTKSALLETDYSRGIFSGNLDINKLVTSSIATIVFAPEVGKKVNLTISVKGPLNNIQKTIDTRDLDSYITSKAALTTPQTVTPIAPMAPIAPIVTKP